MDFNHRQWQDWSELMRRTQEGDAEAYERLLSEISPLVFNYVRKRVFDRQKVEDVFQETLLTFHKARRTYRANLPFGPWFFAVIRNSIWTTLKKNQRIFEKEVLMGEFPEFAFPEEEEVKTDDRLRLALESIPVIYRQSVEMLKFRGMSVEAASKELGISKVALRVRAHRGYVLLKKFLESRRGKKNER